MQDRDVDCLEEKVAYSLHDDWATTHNNVKAQYIYKQANTGQMVFTHYMIVCVISTQINT